MLAATALGAAAALGSAEAAAAEAALGAASAECPAAATTAAVGGAAVAEATGGWGAWVPWRVNAQPRRGEVGDAGGVSDRTRGHVPSCGRCRWGAVEEGWEARRAVPMPGLLHMRLAGGCDSAAGGNAEPPLSQQIVASHHCVPQRTADDGVGAPSCHRSAADTRIVSVLTCKDSRRSSPRRWLALMQTSTAVSSTGPGRAATHADANEPAQLRKRTRSAYADRHMSRSLRL